MGFTHCDILQIVGPIFFFSENAGKSLCLRFVRVFWMLTIYYEELVYKVSIKLCVWVTYINYYKNNKKVRTIPNFTIKSVKYNLTKRTTYLVNIYINKMFEYYVTVLCAQYLAPYLIKYNQFFREKVFHLTVIGFF